MTRFTQIAPILNSSNKRIKEKKPAILVFSEKPRGTGHCKEDNEPWAIADRKQYSSHVFKKDTFGNHKIIAQR